MGLSQIGEFEAHTSAIESVAFSPVDARVLATSNYGAIYIWELSEDGRTSALRHRLSGHFHQVRAIAWSSDGLFLVSGSYDKTIRRWNTSSGACELTIQTPERVNAVALSPADNKHILSGGQTTYVWDSSTGEIIFGPLQVHPIVLSVAYSPNGQYFVSGSSDGSIVIWDSTTGTIHLAPFKSHSIAINSIAFHPTSEAFATASFGGMTVVWDANTFETIHEIPDVSTNTSEGLVQYSPDGRFTLGTSQGQIRVLDAQTGKVLGKPPGVGEVAVAFSQDGQWIASGSDRGSVKIWKFLEWGT